MLLSQEEFLSNSNNNNIALFVANSEVFFVGCQKEKEKSNMILAKRPFAIDKSKDIMLAVTGCKGSMFDFKAFRPKHILMTMLRNFKILALTEEELKKATLTDGKYIISLRGYEA